MRFALIFSAAILAATTAQADTQNISIKGFAFDAADISIAVGDSVVWTNQDGAPHTATATNGGFNTGTLNKGGTGGIEFTQTGTFDYVCKFHPNMKGRITVN